MNNKEIIKDILIEEISKCNNFNYLITIGNLYLSVNTKKLNQSLIDNSSYFEGGINSKWIFESHKNKCIYLSYDNIWSKFDKKTQLKYIEIQSIVKDVLEEGFKLKGITPRNFDYLRMKVLEEGFKLKGITPSIVSLSTRILEKRFKLKGITPSIVSLSTRILEKRFKLKRITHYS